MTSRNSVHEEPYVNLPPVADRNVPGSTSGTTVPLINCDHVSLLVCSPQGTGYEYFLGVAGPYSSYGLVGTRAVNPGETWKTTADAILQNSKLTLKLGGIIRIDRWFVPEVDRMSSHVVYLILVKPELRKSVSAAFAGVWLSGNQLSDYNRDHKLLCPDVHEIVSSACVSCVTGIQVAAGNELTADQLVKIESSESGKKIVGFDSVVAAAHFYQREQETLYKEFMFYAVPYFTLGKEPFFALMKQIGCANSLVPNLFRTFDMNNRGGLTFRELLYGLSAIEPTTTHGGPPAEIRCRYIFRFYDRNNDGKLDFEEFKGVVADIRQARGLPYDPVGIQQEAQQSARNFNSVTPSSLTLVEFLTAVGQLKFRGTSHLLRSPASISAFLKIKSSTPLTLSYEPSPPPTPRPLTPPTVIYKKSNTNTVMDMTMTDGLSNLFDTYDIASHSVKVRKSGTILNINSLWDMEHSGVSGQAQHSKILIGPDVNRLQSIDRFNQETQHNEMLNGLRFFQRVIPSDPKNSLGPKPAYDWGEVDRESLAKCILTLCAQVKDLMSEEPRLLEVPSPCYILGDIHGNFPDLLSFEKALWRLGPMLTPSNFLFLGDYVDRGNFGVEVVSYLFAQKVIAPAKFYLLRGNHEIREVQQMFTFFKECISKFGEKSGREIWEAVNSAFDCMPLAAVVDRKVFCAHGGIPPPWIGNGLIDAINGIPCPLPQPEAGSALAWELMWGDPLHLDMLTPEQKQQLVMRDGFGPNLRRGTAHVFNEEGLDMFLAKNGLSHVIRAHEVQQAGFKVQLKGRLLTVFSSSKYCGGSNEAACILAEKYKLRTIRIDTS